MSKKSRKKSLKSSTRAKTGTKRSAPARAKSGKTRSLPAAKSTKNAVSGPSPKSASKPSSAPKANTPAVAKAESAAGKSPQLAEGAKAPPFRLPRDGGEVVSLSDFAGQKLVLFFYPRANTPGCTKEAIDFTRLSQAFAESGTAVLGVSADKPKAQEAFRDKHKLNVPLISDEKHEMLEAYGAWGEKSLYGRTFMGIIRTTVLIGGDGRIKRIWRHVKVDGHADEVLAAARAA
ncbi:thioredoxin-dependent thiol peroxidase [Bradyrhizobium sp. ARR65]|uniref:thioredoxin-dependent thiol peroxidase n=1 Tax=Bradyrhizobium sp. ARR65 TaxID=1040989 RepID=UPI000463638B|nr:thioredoxin-dependent thiol peroxidase [Bradyrhizobium sp. ARR65]